MAGSMMKDYVRRQLRYWVDGYKDDLLPRDFLSKSFTKTQLLIPAVELKPHRIAAVLHLPSPLLVTSVRCIELTIAVPSWSDSDKEAAHRPVLIHMNELLVEVRNVWECSSQIRRAAEERVQAALLEPDPLGSTAAMFEFARDVNDRTKLVVDRLCVQVFIGGVCRVEMILADLHARTTDALWQDVKDPTTCVDYSPDSLVQTRFKAMSCMLSVGINPLVAGVRGGGAQTIRLMAKVSLVVRITRFYHRKEIQDSWRRHMQLVDVNFGAVKMELGVADFMEVFTVASTLGNWFLNGRSSEKCALSAPVDGMAADREPLGPNVSQTDQASIELQITFRGTLEAKLKFTSPTEGPQELFLIADRAAGNVIIYRHGLREVQISLHELAVRFRGYVVFRLKPDREVFHLAHRHNSLSVKWRVQSMLCRVDDELAAILTEMYQFVNEKEQVIAIRCGTCHQQISLDMIDVHICPPRNSSKALPCTPQAAHTGSRRTSFAESSSAEIKGLDAEENARKSDQVHGPPKLHAILHMDELELQTGSGMAQMLLQLFGLSETNGLLDREVTTKLSNLNLTTESNEFAGDAIFVPALPLAFQMLECSLQGCRCLRSKETMHDNIYATTSGITHGYRWPARLFCDVAQCIISSQECFVKVEKVQIHSSFSDGSRVCFSSQPQLGFHVNIDKIRCQLDDALFRLARQVYERIGKSSSNAQYFSIMTLFLGVIQIRAVEFTLQNSATPQARAKSLLKQAIVVFDNQLGYLCTQSSLDFKTILNLPTMQFVHRQTPAARTITEDFGVYQSTADESTESIADEMTDAALQAGNITEHTRTNQVAVDEVENACSASEEISSSLTKPEFEREDASRCIQRMVRQKQIVRQERQHFQPDDYEPGVVKPIPNPTLVIAVTQPENEGNSSSPDPSPRKMSLGIPSPIMVLSVDNDIIDEIRGGISKLMSPLSRARLPSDSIRGGINKLMGPINRTLLPTGSVKRRQSVESVAPMVEVAVHNVTASTESSTLKKLQALREGELEGQDNVTAHHSSEENKLHVSRTSATSKTTQNAENGDKSTASRDIHEAKPNGLSEAKLAALPDVVRVLVQVDECRLCVPINPREKVEYLCRGIVRRFNESFAADRGNISVVSLQDKHGGIFSPSDTVGFLLCAAPDELLFAYPHEHDGQVRSMARLTPASSRTSHTSVRRRTALPQIGDAKPMRCSKLPLPLVIALLANESERDLTRSGFCERGGSLNVEAWPDLALNAATLDAEKNPLIVEIAWHETCIAVTNDDAFALCRQLLGLCTSRATSKYVGKILRSRLKVDVSNPLVEWACRRGIVMEMEAHCITPTPPSDQEVPNTSYTQLKKAVQDVFGVYTR